MDLVKPGLLLCQSPIALECKRTNVYRAEHGARTLDDLLKSEEKEYGRKIAKAQKVCPLVSRAE
jgi:hypothetical protein